MFSMTATAPESLRRQRRDHSPRVTPTKTQQHPSPPVLPYSPLMSTPGQRGHHSRRYSGVLMDDTVGGCLRQPPAMPLDDNNDNDNNGGDSDGLDTVAGERLLREGLREREETRGGGDAEEAVLLFRENNNYDTTGGASSSTGRDGSSSQSLAHSDAGNTINVNNPTFHSPWRTPTKKFSTNTATDQYNNIHSCHSHSTTNNTSCESPTEESLQQMEAAISYDKNNAGDGSNGIHRMYEYKRSPSMEPLFDRHDEAERPDKRRLYATLQTVYSMDQGEDGGATPTTAATTATAVGEEEGVAVLDSMMTCPAHKTQSSLIREAIMSNEENGMDETCSSTNGVFMEDGAATNNESSGSSRCLASPFRRSTSMQPMFDRDSDEKPLSFGECSTNAGGDSDGNCAAQYNNPDMSPVQEMPSPESHNPTSPIVYTLSGPPASPLHSEINTDITMVNNDNDDNPCPVMERNDAYQRVCAQLTGVTLSHDSGSEDIGGDTYFDQSVSDIGGDAYFDRDDDDDDLPRRGEGNNDDGGLMQPIALPPRLKRTTTDPDSEDENVALDFAISPGRLGPHRSPSPMRRSFGNTHSLLDDCSDEEDDLTSVNMNTVDIPKCHTARSYSCFPKKHANANNNRSGSPYASYLNFNKKQKPNNRQQQRESNHPIMNSAIVDNNIQKALLETRHRRWSCQSAMAGSHAQSNQVLDVSNRVQYIPIRENRLDWNYNRHDEYEFSMDDSEYSDDIHEPMVVLARMSVSHAAIRSGALACGLWRTVRLVKLPRGLFEKHWLMWREKKHSFEEVYDENGVWALLQMLRETFPLLDQVDFGGDTADASYDDDIRPEWTKEIISRVLQILPNLIAIDGFDVAGRVPDAPCAPHHTEFVPMKKSAAVDEEKSNLSSMKVVEDTNAICVQEKSSDACSVCEPVDNMQMCGWSHLVDTQTQTIQEVLSFEVANTVDSELVDVEVNASFAAPEQCSVAREISSDAKEDVSQNILSMIEGCVGPNQERRESYTLDYEPPLHIESELSETRDEDIEQMRASPVSSSSWEATNPPTRPPKCPGSSIHRRNPKKLLNEKKPSKGSVLKARFKRRVLGIIPSSSVIDEDSDSDENEDMTGECPTDML